jgi:hypothetical protein
MLYDLDLCVIVHEYLWTRSNFQRLSGTDSAAHYVKAEKFNVLESCKNWQNIKNNTLRSLSTLVSPRYSVEQPYVMCLKLDVLELR